MSNKWKLSGTYFEACNCDAACPCVFLSDPTEDECTALVGWHIEDGHLEGVSLDGLNVVLAVVSPGNMVKVKWDAAIYFDYRADEAQQNALTRIFTGYCRAGWRGGNDQRASAVHCTGPNVRCCQIEAIDLQRLRSALGNFRQEWILLTLCLPGLMA